MDEAATKGQPLVVSGAIADKADIEAVLLPYDVSVHVFGREVADNYAAVEVIVSNHSADQSLIVQSIFIDYSQWALSGNVFLKKMGEPGTTKFQKASRPNQIASAEYRVVRGDALDAQPWSKRNVTVRALRLAGSIATAFSFVTANQDIVRGIGAFAGQGVPAAETFWPDGTVEQLNRINDLGFKVNKVIPKSASDVIVAFFPLKRFLTPGLNKLFKKSPALFFAPYALVFDSEARKQLAPLFAGFVGKDEMGKDKADRFMKAMALVYMCSYEGLADINADCDGSSCDPSSKCKDDTAKAPASTDNQGISNAKIDPSCKAACERKQIEALITNCETRVAATMTGMTDEEKEMVPLLMKFLTHASLNTIRVVIGGDFTLNVNDIPAVITGVELDKGAAAWTTSGDQTGTIHGSFLATGAPAIVEADKLKIKLAGGDSTDDTLKFTITLPDPPLKAGTTLTFRVDKTNAETKKTVQGVPFAFPVPTPPPSTTMDVGTASTTDNILKISGQGFADTTDQPLTVVLSSPSKTDITLSKTDFQSQTSTEIDIDLCNLKPEGLSLDDSTWTVKVLEGKMPSANSATFKAPASAASKCPQSAATTPAQAQSGANVQGKKPAHPTARPTPATKQNAAGENQKKGDP